MNSLPRSRLQLFERPERPQSAHIEDIAQKVVDFISVDRRKDRHMVKIFEKNCIQLRKVVDSNYFLSREVLKTTRVSSYTYKASEKFVIRKTH